MPSKSEEITALKARLAASEAEVASLREELVAAHASRLQWWHRSECAEAALKESERKREEAERSLAILRDSVQDVLWAGNEWSTDLSINGCLNSEQRLKDSLARLKAAIPQESKRTNG